MDITPSVEWIYKSEAASLSYSPYQTEEKAQTATLHMNALAEYLNKTPQWTVHLETDADGFQRWWVEELT